MDSLNGLDFLSSNQYIESKSTPPTQSMTRALTLDLNYDIFRPGAKRKPIRFGELVDVETNIERIGKSSVTYKFLFRRDETVIAEGQVTAACCELTEGGAPRSVAIPENVRAKLERA